MCNSCSFYSSIYKRDTFSLLPVIFAYIHFGRNVDDSQNIILPCEVQLQHSKKCQVTSSEIDRNECAQISCQAQNWNDYKGFLHGEDYEDEIMLVVDID